MDWLFGYVFYFELSGAVDDWDKRLVALEDTVFCAHEPAFLFEHGGFNEINKPRFLNVKWKLIKEAFLLLQYALIGFNNIDNTHTDLIQLLSRLSIIIHFDVLIMHLLLKHFVYVILFPLL